MHHLLDVGRSVYKTALLGTVKTQRFQEGLFVVEKYKCNNPCYFLEENLLTPGRKRLLNDTRLSPTLQQLVGVSSPAGRTPFDTSSSLSPTSDTRRNLIHDATLGNMPGDYHRFHSPAWVLSVGSFSLTNRLENFFFF